MAIKNILNVFTKYTSKDDIIKYLDEKIYK